MKYMDDAAIADLNMQAQDIFELGLINNEITVDEKVWVPDEGN